jgi:hypothetical protein
MRAAAWEDAKFTVKRSDATGRPTKGRRLIARQRTAVATGYITLLKKRWMTPLQRGWRAVVPFIPGQGL